MKISKELIEKYHRDECSKAESDAVEAWLFDEETTDTLELPEAESKLIHKDEMWNEIKSVLSESTVKNTKTIRLRSPYWQTAVAASLILGFLTVFTYQFISGDSGNELSDPISVNNTSKLEVRQIDSKGYNISIGPNTKARINYQTGIINFSGSILISPKKDIELTLTGGGGKMIFRMGQTYIAMNGKTGSDKAIIVSDRNLTDLPPALQKQLISHFNI